MKNRTTLVLMELLVMVLVFALASAACLGIFAHGDRISRETEKRTRAMAMAQNGAETVKALGTEAAAQALGAAPADRGWATEPEDGLRLEILPQEDAPAGLGRAEIRVWDEAGQMLASLTVAWQEVA